MGRAGDQPVPFFPFHPTFMSSGGAGKRPLADLFLQTVSPGFPASRLGWSLVPPRGFRSRELRWLTGSFLEKDGLGEHFFYDKAPFLRDSLYQGLFSATPTE